MAVPVLRAHRLAILIFKPAAAIATSTPTTPAAAAHLGCYPYVELLLELPSALDCLCSRLPAACVTSCSGDEELAAIHRLVQAMMMHTSVRHTGVYHLMHSAVQLLFKSTVYHNQIE